MAATNINTTPSASPRVFVSPTHSTSSVSIASNPSGGVGNLTGSDGLQGPALVEPAQAPIGGVNIDNNLKGVANLSASKKQAIINGMTEDIQKIINNKDISDAEKTDVLKTLELPTLDLVKERSDLIEEKITKIVEEPEKLRNLQKNIKSILAKELEKLGGEDKENLGLDKKPDAKPDSKESIEQGMNDAENLMREQMKASMDQARQNALIGLHNSEQSASLELVKVLLSLAKKAADCINAGIG